MDKILTIIIPTYNMEKYLHKCLDSLILSDEQMESLEVLVINDGSKDPSSAIGHEYEKRYPQTYRVIDKENGNYGSCVNRGIKEASGKYIKILDADDYFDTSALHSYLGFLSEQDADMVLTDFNKVDMAGNVIASRIFRYDNHSIYQITEHCLDPDFPSMQMHAVTYKRERLISNEYVQTTGCAYTDQEWVFLPITYMQTFTKHDGTLYQYLVGREGQSISPAVVAKQADVKFNLIFHRIQQYNEISKSHTLHPNMVEFLRQNLCRSICGNYKRGIIYRPYEYGKIEFFDRQIRLLNEELYSSCPKSIYAKYHGFRYIEYWRKKGDIPLIIKTLKRMETLKRRILS